MTIEANIGRASAPRAIEPPTMPSRPPATDHPKAIILGGRGGRRRLDPTRSQPLALVEARDRPVLDWIAGALRAHDINDLTYVGGYQLQKVMARYPELAYHFHMSWQTEGEVAAMLVGIGDGRRDHLVVRGDTVLRAEAVDLLLGTPGALVAGTRIASSGETVPTGSLLIRAGRIPEVVSLMTALVRTDPQASLDALIDLLPLVARVDLTNLAAPIGEPASLLGTIFRGKARTLAGIAALTKRAIVLDQVRFGVVDWATDPAAVLGAIRGAFGSGSVVVRSSSIVEDGAVTSGAGRFASVLDVALADEAALEAAIRQVVESYRAGGRPLHPLDEVLVQPHVRDLAASGVLFTRDLSTGGPYFVLSIDRASGRSDVVTSGADGTIDTHYASWAATGALADEGAAGADIGADPDLGRLLDLGRELIGLAYLDALDIEFGLDRSGAIYLFQVRPLVARPAPDRVIADDDLLAIVAGAREFVAERTAPRPGVPGRRSILGNMPDWNPAEMIGAAPRPLALSLYQRLIGDRAWAHARARLGYRDLQPEPLILSVGGRPYVDVRASLASFLPADLDDATAARWVDACIDRIAAEPHLHDKIEFEVTPTCLAFDWPEHAARMRAAGLGVAAIERFRAGLGAVTGGLIADGNAGVRRELAAIDRLAGLRARSLERTPAGGPALGRAIRDHLERCERHGVEPFAVLARQAFVAMALLRSLGRRGVLGEDEIPVVLRSIPTVATETIAAIDGCTTGALPTATFVSRFGHLRSNSYEITAPNYAASLERVLGAGHRPAPSRQADAGAADADAIFERAGPDIERLLVEAGLPGDRRSLLAFIRAAIAGRERAKFEFMKDLDLILETSAEFGAELGLDRDDLSYLHVGDLLLYATDSLTGATAARLRRAAGQHRKQAALTAAFRLPDVIRGPADVLAFREVRGKPNFVTPGRVVARAAALDEGAGPADLDGAIVLVRAADPGYDWIFSHRIAGLVTQYGGMGSHMAIRAAEFGLPAAIGCGDAIFEALTHATMIELDCANQRVRPGVGLDA
jgi:phosphohistidine swiveling domain-containing protein